MGPILQVDFAALQQLSADLSRIADQISGIDSAGPIFEAAAALNSSAVAAVSTGNAGIIADAIDADVVVDPAYDADGRDELVA